MPGKLDGEVAGKTIRALDDDRARAIAGEAVEHRGKTGPSRDRVGTLGRSVVVPIDNLVAG
jgi:hypothetical protein